MATWQFLQSQKIFSRGCWIMSIKYIILTVVILLNEFQCFCCCCCLFICLLFLFTAQKVTRLEDRKKFLEHWKYIFESVFLVKLSIFRPFLAVSITLLYDNIIFLLALQLILLLNKCSAPSVEVCVFWQNSYKECIQKSVFVQ